LVSMGIPNDLTPYHSEILCIGQFMSHYGLPPLPLR
jgi:hypothetical protein